MAVTSAAYPQLDLPSTSGSFRLLALGPGTHTAFEDYLAVRCLDGDPVRIDLCTAAESLLDLALYLGRLDARLQLYRVADALDPFHPPDRAFGAQSLKVPLDLPFEGDPAIANQHLELLGDERQSVSNRCDRVAGDFGVRSLIEARQAHLDVVCQSDDASHPLCRRFGLELVAVAARKPGQGDDTILYGYGDVGGVDIRIPPQLVFDVPLDIAVGPHRYLLGVSCRSMRLEMPRDLTRLNSA